MVLPMRLIIDLQACQGESRDRGIGRYSFFLAKNIAQLRGDKDVRVVLDGNYSEKACKIEKQFKPFLPTKCFSRYYYPMINSKIEYSNEIAELLIQKHYAKLQPDILHISSIFEHIYNYGSTISANLLHSLCHVTRSATLYDLIPLLFKDLYLENNPVMESWYYRKLNLLKSCDLLLTISETSRQDAINLLNISPDKIINISAGCDPLFKVMDIAPNQMALFKKKYKINKNFVLYTGGADLRKNISGLINGYSRLPDFIRKQHQLVITCAIEPEQLSDLVRYVKQTGLSELEVIFTGFVPDTDLVLLYNLCKLFIFPSLYEGFGLPILEAMQCKAPVIGSDSSAIQEIIRRNDAMFDANKPEKITQALVQALTDDSFLLNLSQYSIQRAKDFSWEKSAQTAIEAFVEVNQRKHDINTTKIVRFLPRRKIAYFSPLLQPHSYVTDRSTELLPELARHFDIELFIDDYTVEDEWLKHNFKIFNYRDYPSLHSHYDLTLFHLGNSNYHAYMYELLLQFGGAIVLDDSFLSGITDHMGSVNLKSGEIIKSAKGIIVHSQSTADLLNQYYPDGILAPIRTIKQTHKGKTQAGNFNEYSVNEKLGLPGNDKDDQLRTCLSKKSIEYAKMQHNLESIAAQYALVLHEFVERYQLIREDTLIAELAQVLAVSSKLPDDVLNQVVSYAFANIDGSPLSR
jgi:glycosyltransferase involved in cell wall biosynthesis